MTINNKHGTRHTNHARFTYIKTIFRTVPYYHTETYNSVVLNLFTVSTHSSWLVNLSTPPKLNE
jgi:hypothetical protein